MTGLGAARNGKIMIIAGLALTGVAALIHVFIFYLESIAWTSDRTRATFGTTAAEAETTKSLALNQGFYNLFLALVVGGGVFAFAVGQPLVGATMVFVGAGSMVAASVVLLVSSPDKAGAALKQGVIPALGIIALAIGLAH